jgi:hypothetical protein
MVMESNLPEVYVEDEDSDGNGQSDEYHSEEQVLAQERHS